MRQLQFFIKFNLILFTITKIEPRSSNFGTELTTETRSLSSGDYWWLPDFGSFIKGSIDVLTRKFVYIKNGVIYLAF
jgi:hypothetical protein